jgi:hypothetical protein
MSGDFAGNQWTQFEDFPYFMTGVKDGDETGAWRGRVHDGHTVPGRIPGDKAPR